MNQYEVLLMLDPDLADDRQSEIIARAEEIVTKGGGAWLGAEPWGRRKLAYEIDKKTDGVYHLLAFDCQPSTLDELTRVLRITEGAMRHMATRRPAVATKAQPAPEPTAEPEPARTPEPEAGPTPEPATADTAE